jgi:hypothetical protein
MNDMLSQEYPEKVKGERKRAPHHLLYPAWRFCRCPWIFEDGSTFCFDEEAKLRHDIILVINKARRCRIRRSLGRRYVPGVRIEVEVLSYMPHVEYLVVWFLRANEHNAG